MRKVFLFTILMVIIGAAVLKAQWTSDPLINTKICDTTGEQALVKISNTTDGGAYIGWFDNRGGSYAVYLQRINASGIPQLAPGGILISNNPQNSSLVGWDMKTDAAGNAILAFTDIRNGELNPFIYKVSPSGNMLWGANGITLTDSSAVYQANPIIACTPDTGVVVTWIYASTPRKVALQRINSAGVPQWGAIKKLSSGTNANFDWPAVIPSDSNNIILLYSYYTGTFLSPQNYKLFTQKFNPSGNPLWGNPQDTIYNQGRVNGFYTPFIISDGNGGAVYCWQDDRDMNNLQSVFVQRKTANGTLVFPVDGVECSNVSTDNHFTPIGAYMPSTGETYVFWSESNSGQTLAGGLLGQKISATGTRLWNDAGVYFKPMDNNTFSSLYVIVRDTKVYVSWDEAIYGSANSNIRALKTGRSGIIGWTGSIVNVSTVSSNKIRMNYIMNPAGMGIMTWEDMRIDGGIYAQNLNLNGTLGNPVNINPNGSSIPEQYNLYQNFPNPFNPFTKINFDLKEQGFVTLKVYDMLGRIVSRLINGNEPAGKYSIEGNAENFSSGVYFYCITVNGFSDIKKMIILK
jgi:hypothetical protein